MPFYRRSVTVRVRPAGPLTELRDTCSLAALALLRQLAEICGHSVALLGDIESHLRALARRAAHLHRRASRLQALLRSRPLRAAATGKGTPAKLPWNSTLVLVYLPWLQHPEPEHRLMFSRALRLQHLLQLLVLALWEHPSQVLSVPMSICRQSSGCCLLPSASSRRAAEEESTSGTALGTRPHDTSLSLPTSPDKQPAWPRAFPLPPLEEKQWHQPDSIQTNIVPINVS
ncbi:NHS protein, partial [Smithornis capensis]|nr:NHS protein [Smithornis capensis]